MLSSRFEDALVYAIQAHSGQVEDQGGMARLAEIRERFGERVARIVEECSDALEQPKPPWRERKERYLAHLETTPPDTLRVSLCDKLHNARAVVHDYRELGEALWDRLNVGRDEQLWYYRSLVEVFGRCSQSPLAHELVEAVAELGRLVPKS